MASNKKIVALSRERTKLVDNIINALDKRTGTAQNALFRAMVEDFVDKLDKDGDRIKNTQRNRDLVSNIDKVYESYITTGQGAQLAASVVSGVSRIVQFNQKYFHSFGEKAKLAPVDKEVKETVGAWLGITQKGGVEKNGYLETLVKDYDTLQTLKDMGMNVVIGQKGFFEARKDMQDYIKGGEGKTGRLKSYYNNYVYDMFSQVDRSAGKIYGDKLQLNYAIYEGGIIKTSRQFCKDRNGKVFSREEIAEFDPQEARPPGYDPFRDLGGYRCRHHLNWVPDAVAFAMRPELRLKTPVPIAPPKVQVVGTEAPARQAANTAFDKIPQYKTKPFIFNASDRVLQKKADASASRMRTLQTRQQEERDEYQAISKQLQKPGLSVDERVDIQLKLAKFEEDYMELTRQINKEREIIQETNDTFRNRLVKGQAKSTGKITNASTKLTKDAAFMEKAQAAEDFFRVAARGYMEDLPVTIKLNKTTRDYAMGSEIFVQPKTKIQTIIHELAHQLERHNEVLKYSVDFLLDRTAGKQVKRLKDLNPAYGSNELYRDGGFYSPYVGKIYAALTGRNYKGYRATEVISMGLERMYSDPLGFYREDPEHFHFIHTLFFAK